ncbi:hypothetical protein MD484_g7574, partial [Candolleomyces efflorescens]
MPPPTIPDHPIADRAFATHVLPTNPPLEEFNPFNPPPKLDHLDFPIVTPSRPGSEAKLKRMLEQPSHLSPTTRSSLKSAGEIFGKKQRHSTPYNNKIHEALKPNPKRDEHKKLIEFDLGPLIGLEDGGAWATSLYADLVSKEDIDAFFGESGLYDKESSKRWTIIPESSKDLKEELLYEPFVNITNAILEKFVLNGRKTGKPRRKAIDTHVTDLMHREEVQAPRRLRSRPDVSIKARGSSFEMPEAKADGTVPEVGFSNMSSFQEMKLQKDETTPGSRGLQVAVYARQIFIHQPNRRYVRALLLTETNVRLFHFDRSGGLYTPYINIHEDPYTFVRLVVGLNSLDHSVLGLDTSIKWKVDHGKKVSGTLTARGNDDTQIVYHLAKLKPIITSFDICGRGTQCWSVCDPVTGDKLIIKDCWKAEDRVFEYKHLKKTKGLQGIAQMLSFEKSRGTTQEFRAPDSLSDQAFLNRIETRVLMNSYGESLESFKSPTELLYGLRDGIKGHMNLFLKNRLHRDITIHNILLGKKVDGSRADPGYRGFLIDLYMTIHIKRDINLLSSERRTGSRRYLSIAVLLCCKGSAKNPFTMLAHDHLDDFESFFYIYCYMLHVYNSRGYVFDVPEMFVTWEQAGASAAADSKYAFMRSGQVEKDVASRWPAQCIKLLKDFRKFLLPHIEKKKGIIERGEGDQSESDVKKLMDKAVGQYEMLLHLFDVAIQGLEEDEADAAFSPVEHHPGQNALKRELDDEDYFHGPLRVKRRHGLEVIIPEASARDFEAVFPRSPHTPGGIDKESQAHHPSPPPSSPESD